MSLWVLLAVLAAAFQTVRFALQKVLAGGAAGPGSGPLAATFARFLWAAPLAALGLAAMAASGAAVPGPGPAFLAWAAAGGLSQIVATVLVVRLFGMRDFAVGIALKKTEVILTALAGLALLGDAVTAPVAAALAVGLAGVMLLSDARPADWRPGPALWIGLGSGAAFALSAVGYRAAALSLEADWAMRAITTLAWVTAGQAAGMAAWLAWRRPGTVGAVVADWRRTGPVGAASAAGSACWFGAFALQSAALVFAVGQVELVFSLLLGRIAFGERPGPRALGGIVLLGASVVTVALAG